MVTVDDKLSAHDVTRVIRERIPGVGDVALQKLLYYCQGMHLAWTGRQLFPERIEAWDMGPVVADVWRVNKYQLDPPAPHELGPDAMGTVGYVLERWGSKWGYELIDLTHAEPPWTETPRNGVIKPEVLQAYFSRENQDPEDEIASEALANHEYVAFLRDQVHRVKADPPAPDDEDAISELLGSRGS